MSSIAGGFTKLKQLRIVINPESFAKLHTLCRPQLKGLHLLIANTVPSPFMSMRPRHCQIPSDDSWKALIQQLKGLRIDTRGYKPTDRSFLKQILASAYSVDKFLWACSMEPDVHPKYDSARRLTHKQLDIANGRNDHALRPIDYQGKVAFLSIVRLNEPNGVALGQLNQDAMEIIFQFATSHISRQAWVDINSTGGRCGEVC